MQALSEYSNEQNYSAGINLRENCQASSTVYVKHSICNMGRGYRIGIGGDQARVCA